MMRDVFWLCICAGLLLLTGFDILFCVGFIPKDYLLLFVSE